MANICNYEIRVKGKKSDVRELVEWMNAEYDTAKMYCSEKHHFYKIAETTSVVEFEAMTVLNKDEDIIVVNLIGYCNWSVLSCMILRDSFYYKNGDDYAITMQEASKLLDVDIEIISEELGLNFTEYFLIIDGEIIKERCEPFLTDEDFKIYSESDYESESYENRCNEVYNFTLS